LAHRYGLLLVWPFVGRDFLALGALIGAYQEDESGGLAALLPLAGRTLVEYQARCAAAAGATPIVVLVERIPLALNQAFERLRADGITVTPVSDGAEAASRFEAGELILMIGDGVAPPVGLLAGVSDDEEPLVLTVPDDEPHERFERINSTARWGGVALVEARTLGATAAMLGDWDLPSTLLRRMLQDGARLVPIAPESEPLLASNAGQLQGFERSLITSSRIERRDIASRYLLAPIEDFATERLIETNLKPQWLMIAALVLTLGAAFAFTRGWLWAGLAALILSTPLDLIAKRLGILRLKPLPSKSLTRSLLWPSAGLAVLALGLWQSNHGGGWGALLAAGTAVLFAQAYRLEMAPTPEARQLWTFSRRNAILASIPFAAFGGWTVLLVVLLAYAALSFFFVQYVGQRVSSELTTH
jgi:hypothetical protein